MKRRNRRRYAAAVLHFADEVRGAQEHPNGDGHAALDHGVQRLDAHPETSPENPGVSRKLARASERGLMDGYFLVQRAGILGYFIGRRKPTE